MKAVKRMWFEWGDEPVEHCHVWHVGHNGDVMFDGIMSIEKARKICDHKECPFN